jgi:hypothetical protein
LKQKYRDPCPCSGNYKALGMAIKGVFLMLNTDCILGYHSFRYWRLSTLYGKHWFLARFLLKVDYYSQAV